MDQSIETAHFNKILKNLAERIETHDLKETVSKPTIVNRIDLRGFREIQKLYRKDRSLCKKTLDVPGRLRLDVQYGPTFETKLKTERAGEINIQMDENTLFGGGGTGLTPIQTCMAGFCGCFSAAFAKWAAMEGIELNTLKIRTKANVDLTTILGIANDVPIVDDYQIELIVSSEATAEELYKIVEFTKKRCFCYYCITTMVFPKITLKKVSEANIKAIDDKSTINRMNLNSFMETSAVYSQNRSLCKKVLAVEGKWRLDVHYGPQFEILLPTEKAGDILVQTDETIILGGGGTSFNPVALCIAGFSGDIAHTFAKWAGMSGIILKSFKTKAKMNIDLTTGFGIEDGLPMIDDYELELSVDSDASIEELQEILEIVKKRCFCYYCYNTRVFPRIVVNREIKEVPEAKVEKIQQKAPVLEAEINLPLDMIRFDVPHNIKLQIGKSMKMREI